VGAVGYNVNDQEIALQPDAITASGKSSRRCVKFERRHMALIDKTTRRAHIPHEASEENGGPHWVDIRQLSGAEMDDASEARTDKVLARMSSVIAGLQNVPDLDKRTDKESMEVRRQTYDPDILINYALQAWSYSEPLGETPSRLLDAITRDWLWELIVEANTRPPASWPV
jgi:hypothetical protein